MNFNYLISTYNWCFDSDYPLIDSQESQLFRLGQSTVHPDWKCQVHSVEVLPPAQGKLISETAERRLYQEEGLLWMEFLNRKDREPIFSSAYFLDEDSEVRLWSLESQYPYTARMEHIWSAVDFPHHLLQKGILTLHSAVIETDGQAVLFLAPSGTGKSTQAQLWHKLQGAKQLNGDKAGIAFRDDTVMAYGVPFCGTSGICTNFEIPVRALVFLSQSKENSIYPLAGVVALRAILENCFGHRVIVGDTQKMITIAVQILQKVPIYSLSCTPDERAVTILRDELRKEW